MQHVSIIITHYSLYDDHGEERRYGGPPRSDMLYVTMGTLSKYTDYPAEIIVVDNGGDKDDSNYLLDLNRSGVINTYIRNKNNMNFGWGWNQAAKLATGDYLCFTCNDLQFKENWLSQTIKPLLNHPEKKLIATPLVTPDKNAPKWQRGELDGYRLNAFAGSNCMLMHKSVYQTVGEFSTSTVAGTLWHRTMHKMGYLVVAPPEDLAIHLGQNGGVNFYRNIKVKKILLNGEEVDYSYA
jgi:glycosyltransferase involved in cell wall biosynthesis